MDNIQTSINKSKEVSNTINDEQQVDMLDPNDKKLSTVFLNSVKQVNDSATNNELETIRETDKEVENKEAKDVIAGNQPISDDNKKIEAPDLEVHNDTIKDREDKRNKEEQVKSLEDDKAQQVQEESKIVRAVIPLTVRNIEESFIDSTIPHKHTEMPIDQTNTKHKDPQPSTESPFKRDKEDKRKAEETYIPTRGEMTKGLKEDRDNQPNTSDISTRILRKDSKGSVLFGMRDKGKKSTNKEGGEDIDKHKSKSKKLKEKDKSKKKDSHKSKESHSKSKKKSKSDHKKRASPSSSSSYKEDSSITPVKKKK